MTYYSIFLGGCLRKIVMKYFSIFLGWLPESLKMGISPTGMGFRCDLTISNDVSMILMRI